MPGMILAAKIWHYWIGFVLVIASVATVLALVGQYFFKVQRLRYPKRRDDV